MKTKEETARLPRGHCSLPHRRQVEAADPAQSQDPPMAVQRTAKRSGGNLSESFDGQLTADDRRRARLPTRLSRNAPSRGVWPDQLGREMLPIIDALADFGNYYKSIIQ